jgi:hypothetical protein
MKNVMIRTGRVALGMSQRQLAIEAGLSLPTVARFENGRNSLIGNYEKMIGALSGCTFVETKDGFVMTYKHD